jgi:hypothetical protein
MGVGFDLIWNRTDTGNKNKIRSANVSQFTEARIAHYPAARRGIRASATRSLVSGICPHIKLHHLGRLDDRLAAHLDGLR